jgi:hypothetical protein
MDDNNHIDFNAPATLRKWPSIKNERARAVGGPYLIVDGTLDDCIRQFMAKPTSQHHLYEIHTAPQGELVSAVLSAIHILEIVRLRIFSKPRKAEKSPSKSKPLLGLRRAGAVQCWIGMQGTVNH